MHAEVGAKLTGDMMEFILNRVEQMTASERAIAQYIVSNESEVIYLTARELAERVGVSDASIVRFCQSIGFSGFKELKLKIALATQAAEREAAHADADLPLQDKLVNTFERAITSIRNTERTLSPEHLFQTSKRVRAAKRVCLLGAGTSGVVARDLQIKLTRLGITTLFDDQPQNAAVLMALVTPADVVIAFSHSGNTMETLNLLRTGKDRGAFTIAVTNNAGSRIAGIADLVLMTASDELPFHSFAMTSRIAQMVVVDTLVTVLIAELGDDVQENLKSIASAVTELSHGGQ